MCDSIGTCGNGLCANPAVHYVGIHIEKKGQVLFIPVCQSCLKTVRELASGVE